ncbi:hypothetical protein ACHQM5_016334 [Ranunculus cassubicifolius]
MRGIQEFVVLASNHLDKKGRTRCPCKRCKNNEYWQITEVHKHLLDFGMVREYTKWVHHGEVEELSDDDEDDDNDGVVSFEGLTDLLNECRTARENLDPNMPHMGTSESQNGDATMRNNMYRNVRKENDKSYEKLFNAAQQPLYPECKNFTTLDFLVKLMHLKIINNMSNKCFNMILELIKPSYPEGETLPKSYYEAKMLLRSLGLGYIPIDACVNDCALFWKENESLLECPVCKSPRYQNPEGKGKKIPQKVLRYFPLKPRLQRLYMSGMTAQDMRWHKEKRVFEKGVLRHPADSEEWQDFDKEYKWFSDDPRNVRLGIATDGFNPFGDMSSSYSMWPVIVVPYNLPPWKCMKDPFIFMSLLIPGPKAPGNDIDVYLRPLIDELNELWESGVETFDAVTKAPFRLHAAALWTINDFPAYGNLSGWSTKGKMACPVCNEETSSMYLKHGRKLCYMNHARFLPPRHSLRRRANQLFAHLNWRNSRPKWLSGKDVLSQLRHVKHQCFGKDPDPKDKGPQNKKRKRPTTELNWRKRSIFFELPYWRMLKIRHNLDVMHIEKNICENVLGTILKLDGKTKDTLKSRLDLQALGIRPELHLTPKPNNKFLVPAACYTFSTLEKQSFCEWLKTVKFPDGYASNISRCVNVKDCKISGMKSHDCHVLLQRLLPAALRGFLPDDVSSALIELGLFFRELCSKTLKLEVLKKMQKDIVVVLCKLEQIFPPSFFDVMIHLAIHLPLEAIHGGPVQYRWMYPIERFLRTLKQYVRNKARPEGSIAEAYIDNECLTFCSMYLEGIETRFNRKDRNFDGDIGGEHTGLDVFTQNVRPLGASKNCEMSLEEFRKAEFYVLNNSDEVSPFLE